MHLQVPDTGLQLFKAAMAPLSDAMCLGTSSTQQPAAAQDAQDAQQSQGHQQAHAQNQPEAVTPEPVWQQASEDAVECALRECCAQGIPSMYDRLVEEGAIQQLAGPQAIEDAFDEHIAAARRLVLHVNRL